MQGGVHHAGPQPGDDTGLSPAREAPGTFSNVCACAGGQCWGQGACAGGQHAAVPNNCAPTGPLSVPALQNLGGFTSEKCYQKKEHRFKGALTAGDRVTRDRPVALRVRAAQTATRKDGVWAARALTMASLAAQRPAKDAAGSGAPRQ